MRLKEGWRSLLAKRKRLALYSPSNSKQLWIVVAVTAVFSISTFAAAMPRSTFFVLWHGRGGICGRVVHWLACRSNSLRFLFVHEAPQIPGARNWTHSGTASTPAQVHLLCLTPSGFPTRPEYTVVSRNDLPVPASRIATPPPDITFCRWAELDEAAPPRDSHRGPSSNSPFPPAEACTINLRNCPLWSALIMKLYTRN